MRQARRMVGISKLTASSLKNAIANTAANTMMEVLIFGKTSPIVKVVPRRHKNSHDIN